MAATKNYNYACSASGAEFIRAYTGYFTGEISDALNEILHQDWFIDCETNYYITKDKLLEVSKAPLLDVSYRELPNAYELLICDAAGKILLTADVADWDEFSNALKKYNN